MSYNKELSIDPEYLAMCEKATEFQKRFKAKLEVGRYFRWWDTKYNETRHQVFKEQDEMDTIKEFDSEFVALPMIDQLLGFVTDPLNYVALINKAVNAEKRQTEKYYTKMSSFEKRLLAMILWQSEALAWNGQSWESVR
jgi:hypothetical protein